MFKKSKEIENKEQIITLVQYFTPKPTCNTRKNPDCPVDTTDTVANVYQISGGVAKHWDLSEI